jgi:transposase-like protein
MNSGRANRQEARCVLPSEPKLPYQGATWAPPCSPPIFWETTDLPESERAKLKQLEKEVRELRMENEFLGKATAFFAKKSQ